MDTELTRLKMNAFDTELTKVLTRCASNATPSIKMGVQKVYRNLIAVYFFIEINDNFSPFFFYRVEENFSDRERLDIELMFNHLAARVYDHWHNEQVSYRNIRGILRAKKYKIPTALTAFIYGKELYDEHTVSFEPLTFEGQNYFVLIPEVTQNRIPDIIQTLFILLRIFDEDKTDGS